MVFDFTDLHVNWVDFFIVLALVLGVVRGRKRGMSEELLDVVKWLLIVVVGAYAYQPLGQMFAQFTYVSNLYSYLIVYALIIAAFVIGFSYLRPRMGEKIVGSDFFGSSEYYLGMMAGGFRYMCIILVLFALLNARHFSADEIRNENAYQENNFGSIRFPTPITMQTAVLENSLAGSLARNYLSPFLIHRTDPEDRELSKHSLVRAREQLVDEIMKK